MPPNPQVTDLVDRALALRWLISARRATLVAQVALMVFAEAGTQVHLHSPELLAILGGWAAADVAQTLWFRRRPAPWRLVAVSAVMDLTALTAILVLSGGPHSPLLFGYLAYLALLAMVLPAVQAWAVAGLAMILQGFVVFHPVDVVGLAPDLDDPAHLLGHVVTFDLSAAAITWVVTRLSAALRERAASDRDAAHRREVTDRLAALGTLAAGVAHELGTPLGAIQLLAEQARRPGAEVAAPLATLLHQVSRCRSILDRLRGRDAPSAGDSTLELHVWVAEWQRAAPEVAVVLPSPASPRVLGAAESWRGAVWVALDNARRAGASQVVLTLLEGDEHLDLAIEDDGDGLDEEAGRRAGEPFWTGWGGTGLGLFVARSFARGVGGDVTLEPGEHGAQTRLLIPKAHP